MSKIYRKFLSCSTNKESVWSNQEKSTFFIIYYYQALVMMLPLADDHSKNPFLIIQQLALLPYLCSKFDEFNLTIYVICKVFCSRHTVRKIA